MRSMTSSDTCWGDLICVCIVRKWGKVQVVIDSVTNGGVSVRSGRFDLCILMAEQRDIFYYLTTNHG